MVWYSYLLKNFLQLVVIHTVKQFSIVNEAEVDVFLELPCFLYDPMNVNNLIPGSSAFSKSTLYIQKFSVHVLLRSSLKDFEHNLTIMWNVCNCSVVGTFFSIVFGIGMKTDLFQPCGHCLIFQICWHIECNTLTASSFRILNSLAGILSPPLALCIVMLPKAHLTSHARISGSRWVTTPSWLSRSLRPFLCVVLYIVAASS